MRTTLSLVLSTLLVLTPLAARAQYTEQQVPSSSASAYAPVETHQQQVAREGVPAHTETNWSLIAPGVALLAGGWAIGWLTTIIWNVASASCRSTGFFTSTCTVAGPYGEGYWQMAIPLLGPWMTFVNDDTYRGSDIFFPILMGIMQPVGLGLLIAGLVSPEHVPARAPTAGQVDVRVGLSSLALELHF